VQEMVPAPAAVRAQQTCGATDVMPPMLGCGSIDCVMEVDLILGVVGSLAASFASTLLSEIAGRLRSRTQLQKLAVDFSPRMVH
jgi:hypothetical protein